MTQERYQKCKQLIIDTDRMRGSVPLSEGEIVDLLVEEMDLPLASAKAITKRYIRGLND